ncbi:MAG: MFS transporter [Burkholderiaceae bacterium]|nr:MFS transporter [Burkholderiaceae bacterium]
MASVSPYSTTSPARRTMSLSTLINTFGNGLFMTVEVIYFTLIVGLSPAKVALALSIAGGVALSVSVPAGHISDRFGPRDIAFLAMVLEGALMFVLLSVHTYGPFLLVNIGVAVLGNISQTMRMATIAKLGEGESRVEIRAYQRAVTNFGISLGTIFAGIALAINTPIAYQTLLVADAITFIAAGIVFRKMPFIEPTVERGEPLSFQALRDYRFLGATALNAINSLHFVLQSVAIPLWVVRETTAPRWWVSVIMLVNTVAVMLFQVAASKGSGPINVGAKLYRRASFAIAIACTLYSMSHGVDAIAASAILVIASAVHVYGELIGSAGSWSIGFGLADEKHQGQYQGVWSLSWGLGGTLGPAFVTAMAISLGQIGWFIMAAIFLINGLLMFKLVTRNWLLLPI